MSRTVALSAVGKALAPEYLRAAAAGPCSPDALLLVSGNQKSDETVDSVQGIRLARELGITCPLWCVTDSLDPESRDRLWRKAEAGASTVVCQPPLRWNEWESWLQRNEDVVSSFSGGIRIGVPVLAGTAEVELWRRLCLDPYGLPLTDEMKRITSAFQKQDFQAVDNLLEESMKLRMTLYKDVPCVSGFHLMPVTKLAREKLLQILETSPGILNIEPQTPNILP